METEIELPEIVPAMILPEVALFPQALLPLHIFESRYRQMLRDVLASNRLFAVAGLDFQRAGQEFEPSFRVAGVGIIRACQKGHDGTSNLLLQGLARVEIVDVVTNTPYRQVRVRALASEAGAAAEIYQRLRDEVAGLLSVKARLGSPSAKEMTQFLATVTDPEAFVDIAAFNLCEDFSFKQRLLSTLDVHHRFELFAGRLRREIEALKLRHKLQGGLPEDRISTN